LIDLCIEAQTHGVPIPNKKTHGLLSSFWR
jgi:hypothetical protein